MANGLNISPANFDNNSGFLFVDDPQMWIKILDDVSWTEFKPLGYAKIEKTFSIEREYAEFKTGIPETLVDKAVIGVKRFFKCTLSQLQPEHIPGRTANSKQWYDNLTRGCCLKTAPLFKQ